MENCVRLKIEGEIFDDLRKDINMALQKALKEMTDKDSDEGKISIAIDIKLDKERIPDYSSGQEGKSRDIVKPRFLHKVAHAINIKGERKGGINPEMAMVQDEDDKCSARENLHFSVTAYSQSKSIRISRCHNTSKT